MLMRLVRIVASIMLASVAICLSQTYVTNWVSPPASYRLVGGQLYDSAASSKWVPVILSPQWRGSMRGFSGGSYPRPGELTDITFSADKLGSLVIHIRNFLYRTGDLVEPKAFDGSAHLVSPARSLPMRLFPLSSVTNWGANGTIRSISRTYDYGLPATNKIPVITKKAP